ncbi:MOSC domain-containing protein [Streptomyces massasporeus]|uniref:MOSC domain-containing protein n=1 Tax=Streptomyces massasporeus TaxID=67324 RepID=UPI001E33E0AE|nr:MOSC domain-containing protein [Streptomyces massasporeus]
MDDTGEKITVGKVASGTFFDFGRVHLVTTSSLTTLRSAHPTGDVDPRRFRPNLLVGTGELPAFVQDSRQGRRARSGWGTRSRGRTNRDQAVRHGGGMW